MLLDDKVKIKWNGANRKHFESKGYVYTKRDDVFTANISDLSPRSTIMVRISCDYCDAVFLRKYGNFLTGRDNSPVQKDACSNCKGLKIKETNMFKYGVENVMHVNEFKENMYNTNLKKYGVKNAGGSKQAQDKIRKQNLERYGVEYYFQTEDFKEQYKEKMNEKYGVDNYFASEEAKKYIENYWIENYGVKHNLQVPEYKDKQIQTMVEKYGVDNLFKDPNQQREIRKTLWENGKAPTSQQQKHIAEMLGGELNYPINHKSIDIVLHQKGIAIEYDGSGHRLNVYFGNKTDDDFDQEEQLRENEILEQGFKIIRFISRKDKMPDNRIFYQMLKFAEDNFQNDVNIIRFDFDEDKVIIDGLPQDYKYGYLRSVHHSQYLLV